MKKMFVVMIVFVMLLNTDLRACEICGCGNSNFQIGILPNFRNGFVGLRYTPSWYHSRMQGSSTEFSRDFYQTTELMAGYQWRRFQVIGFVPYFASNRRTDDGTMRANGMGDAMVLVSYRLFSQNHLSKDESTTLRNELYIGAGIKSPTGMSQVEPEDGELNTGDFNAMPGTGSWDFLATATHNLLWSRSGLVTTVAYRVNTSNQQDFQFGNRAYLNTSYFYTLGIGSWKVRPNAGINFQHNGTNYLEGAEVESSTGYSLCATAGVNVNYRNFGVNALAFAPVTQNYYSGQTKLLGRAIFGITYSF